MVYISILTHSPQAERETNGDCDGSFKNQICKIRLWVTAFWDTLQFTLSEILYLVRH